MRSHHRCCVDVSVHYSISRTEVMALFRFFHEDDSRMSYGIISPRSYTEVGPKPNLIWVVAATTSLEKMNKYIRHCVSSMSHSAKFMASSMSGECSDELLCEWRGAVVMNNIPEAVAYGED